MSETPSKVLLTGGSGLLGRTLLRLDPALIAPPHAELEIGDSDSVSRAIEKHQPKIILHAAAMTRTHEVNADPSRAIRANIIGTSNMAVAAIGAGIRLVYVSTDYVYDDTPGPHREDEPLRPANFYTWTKLGGECAVMLVPDSLIIRTTFGPRPCEYDRAAEDKITNKQYVDEVAPQILELAKSDLTGVINLGGPATTIFEHARRSNPNVKPVKLSDLSDPIPRDTSLDLSRWDAFRRGR